MTIFAISFRICKLLCTDAVKFSFLCIVIAFRSAFTDVFVMNTYQDTNCIHRDTDEYTSCDIISKCIYMYIICITINIASTYVIICISCVLQSI